MIEPGYFSGLLPACFACGRNDGGGEACGRNDAGGSARRHCDDAGGGEGRGGKSRGHSQISTQAFHFIILEKP